MDSLGRFSLFVHVADAGSFVKAAQQLGISASAVGKSVSRLEDRLGVSLFRRTTRSISLTEEGSIFLDRCRRILCEIEALDIEFSSRSGEPRGRLKITLPLVNDLFLPTLANFSVIYPQIELDVDFTDRLVDLVDEGFDVAIRTGDLKDSQLVAKRVGRFKLMLVASPDYLRDHGLPAHPSDLAQHVCIRHKFSHSGKLEEWPISGLDEASYNPSTMVVCNNIEALIYFARAGRGIACIPNFLVANDIMEGRLKQVLAEFTEHNGIFSAIWPKSRFSAPRIRAFVEFIVANNPLREE